MNPILTTLHPRPSKQELKDYQEPSGELAVTGFTVDTDVPIRSAPV